jgi:hypothetical protein
MWRLSGVEILTVVRENPRKRANLEDMRGFAGVARKHLVDAVAVLAPAA